MTDEEIQKVLKEKVPATEELEKVTFILNALSLRKFDSHDFSYLELYELHQVTGGMVKTIEQIMKDKNLIIIEPTPL